MAHSLGLNADRTKLPDTPAWARPVLAEEDAARYPNRILHAAEGDGGLSYRFAERPDCEAPSEVVEVYGEAWRGNTKVAAIIGMLVDRDTGGFHGICDIFSTEMLNAGKAILQG